MYQEGFLIIRDQSSALFFVCASKTNLSYVSARLSCRFVGIPRRGLWTR